MNHKYSESEKYLSSTLGLIPKVTTNPINFYNECRNLLLLYTHSDLDKAEKLGSWMMEDLHSDLPLQSKEMNFMMANIYFLKGSHQKAKDLYNHVLKSEPEP